MDIGKPETSTGNTSIDGLANNISNALRLDPDVLKDPKKGGFDPKVFDPRYILESLYNNYKMDSQGILYIPSVMLVNQEPILTYKKAPISATTPSFNAYMKDGYLQVGPREFGR